jgi:hypothetical protein
MSQVRIPSSDPCVVSQAQGILATRRRCNASGQDGEDLHEIIAALVAQRPSTLVTEPIE